MMTAFDILRGRGSECKCTHADIENASSRASEVTNTPISMPLLAGPGAITTVMVLSAQNATASGTGIILLSILVTFVITYFVLRTASLVQQ